MLPVPAVRAALDAIPSRGPTHLHAAPINLLLTAEMVVLDVAVSIHPRPPRGEQRALAVLAINLCREQHSVERTNGQERVRS